MAIQSIRDAKLKGLRVFVRVDFNVPLDEQGAVSDDTRIVAALPTIEALVAQGAKVVLASHLGRPKGTRNEAFSLKPVGGVLAERLGKPVSYLPDCVGPDVEAAVQALPEGGVALLENLRFYAGEEKNDPGFAKQLASLADAYVNDAFGTAHRAHASTVGVPALVDQRYAGFLVERELEFLGTKTTNPERPFVVILGGAKVSDKITVIDALLEKADAMLIGGAMAYTFALAEGKQVGASRVEEDKVDTARKAIAKAKSRGVQLLLPVDHRVASSVDFEHGSVEGLDVAEDAIPKGFLGVDIGPKTEALFAEAIATAKTVLWNGPMGIFEIEACAQGTFSIAKAVAESGALSIIGGGDSVKAIKKSGYADRVTFMSTGGGASLEFLEGKTLPGVEALASSRKAPLAEAIT
ncbi:MAG TPA: phosphoglycerate kinase [Opitutae bacterium]|nr:phosphoglycerate kinase [Opitutae bacterium]